MTTIQEITIRQSKKYYMLAAIAQLILVAGIATFFLVRMSQHRLVSSAAWLILICGIVGVAYQVIYGSLLRYTLKDGKIESREGIIFRTTKTIPFTKITNIATSQFILEKITKTYRIGIETAGSGATEMTLEGIESPEVIKQAVFK